jgi:hypothetical protein
MRTCRRCRPRRALPPPKYAPPLTNDLGASSGVTKVILGGNDAERLRPPQTPAT